MNEPETREDNCVYPNPGRKRGKMLETSRLDGASCVDFPCVHQLIERQVVLRPHAIALVYEEQTITYADLNTRANRIAHRLIELGVLPDDCVALCVARSPAMIIGMLAILKAGGAYVPIDPAYSSARSTRILGDVCPKILLSDEIGRAFLNEDALKAMAVLDPHILPDLPPCNPNVSQLTSKHLAHVMYTSGSTGTPKGVMVEHRNIVRALSCGDLWFNLGPNDTWSLLQSISFSLSTWTLWGSLRCGAKMVIVSHVSLRATSELQRIICRNKITILTLTPSVMRVYVTQYCRKPFTDTLRYIILAGERFNAEILRSWFTLRDDDSPQVVNCYGATEMTLFASYKLLKKHDVDLTISPVGGHSFGSTLYLVDDNCSPVPNGEVGEICVDGGGIARGYLNLADSTSERFLVNPFSEAFDARMYRTGDMAYYQADGSLAFVGRYDQQLKIRGFRVEPCEVEACLIAHPAVRQAHVLVISSEYVDRLVAYVVTEVVDNLPVILHEHVSAQLPEYMVPTAFVRINEFPLNQSGKIDRSALPEPDETTFPREAFEQPQGEIEKEIANIWRKLLGLDKVGRHDSFFAIGGHSLIVARLIEHMRTLGWNLTMSNLFHYPVLSQLAATVERYRDHTIPPNLITPGTTILTPDMLPLIDLTQSDIDRIIDKVPGGVENIQDIYALSPLQDGMLFHHLLSPENDPYYFISELAFADRRFLDRYLAGIQRVVDRHDIFRTSILSQGLIRPAQVVWRNVTISVLEKADVAGSHPASESSPFYLKSSQYPIDLQVAPLLRYVIARDANGRWILDEIIHHLIIDQTTIKLMHDEVGKHMSGREQSLSEPKPFRNFIAQVRIKNDEWFHEQFFREMLRDIHEPTLPYGIAEVHNSGSEVMEAHGILSSELNDALRDQAKLLGVSLASVFHLAYGIMISRISCRNLVVFGTVLYSRAEGSIGDESAMGLFVNTLPVKIDIGESTIHTCLKRTHNLLAELLNHEHASLVLAQRCGSVGVNEPLFSALLNVRHHTSYFEINHTIQDVEVVESGGRTNYPLVLVVEDYQSAIRMTVQTVPQISSQRLLEYMQRTLQSLTDASAQIERKMLRSIKIMPDTEWEDLVKTRNLTEISYSDPPCIHQIFEQQANRTPQATAIVCEQKKLIYAELNDRADQLAHHLIDLGVSEGERVALCVERSPAMIIGVLAILKAGAAYVPIDPAHSSQRSLDIVNDVTPKIALVDDVGRVALGSVARTGLKLVDPNAPLNFGDENQILPVLHSKTIAYIIHTSGTTGKPKGVMVQHRNVVQLLGASAVHFLFDRRDTWCLFHSIAFDFSVWELWGALCHGGKLIIVPRDTTRSPDDLRELIWNEGVTVMNFTPNAFREFANTDVSDSRCSKLRYIIFGGEKLDCSTLKSWYATHSCTSPQLVNMYGITETTVHATYRLLNQRDTNEKASVIGRRLSHNKIYVLDSDRRPVPVGVVGEIFIGGTGVTSGYLNRNSLTNERFFSDHFSDAFDAKMYRTGDLARYLENSELAFMGRNDEQVKIRGFRIEVVEIENCLVEHPLVRQALVRVNENQEFANLVAYVVADSVENLNIELREYISVRLPEYMVPTAFVRLDKFPLTHNGKIDHSALPKPNETAFASRTYEEPSSPLEIELAEIWRNLLSIDKIGRRDSFFALGGHSLLAVRVIEQLRARGLKLSVRDLFNHPILYVLAESITSHQEHRIPPNVISADTKVLTPDMLPLIELSQSEIDVIVDKVPGGLENVQDIYALSPLQEGILFHNLLASGDDPYLVSNFMRFTDRNLLDRYLSAFQRMIDRHDILRTAFVWKDLSAPAQVVCRRALLSIVEVTLTTQGVSVYNQFRSKCLDQRFYGIDLERAPLLRFIVTRDRSGNWLACQQTHHLIGDELSIRSMCVELRAQMTGTDLHESTPYRNLVHTMCIKSSKEDNIRFFSGMLRDIESPTLPFGLSEVHSNHAQMTIAQQTLAPDSMMHLLSATRKLNVGVATLIHVAWALVLSRVCDQRQVVFGTVLSGRMRAEGGSSSAMGLYINTLPLRVDVDDTQIKESIRKVHGSLSDLLEHEHASLVLAQRCSSIPSGQTLFSSLLNFRRHEVVEGSMYPPGIESIEVVGYTNYPLQISIDDDEDAVRLSTGVVRPIDPDRICSYMQEVTHGLVNTLESGSAIPLKSLEILPPRERALLLRKWNEVEARIDLPCIHQLFEQQVLRKRNAIAIVFGNEEISYAELNHRANKLAHELINFGLSPGQCVGLCVSRSPAMIVGIIAIFKAGGAYVPIDPDHASERLSYILSDANPSIVLADGHGRTVLDDINSPTFMILDLDIMSHAPHTNPLISKFCSKELAYIIYTSGTTGKPKGVMVRHQNVVRFLDGTDSWLDCNANDTWCLHHSIAFDFSVWELWGPLSKGAKLIILSQDVSLSSQEIWRIISEREVTVLTVTPSAFGLFEDFNSSGYRLRYIIFGGQKLEYRTLHWWFSKHGDTSPQLVNTYGPTETTVNSTFRLLSMQDVSLKTSPIGRKLSHNRIYLLDSRKQPVPLRAIGEIHIGGAGVACGYLNRYDLTEERFVPDSFSDAFDTKMYRTGDLAYQSDDGELVYIGRKDQQVKVRGFRVEPFEIETCLTSHPKVYEALVRVITHGEFDRLIAYVRAEMSENLIIELREHASTKLPDYMVPSAFVVLDEFPLNQNGKIDCSALPSVSQEAFASRAYEEPQGEVEIKLAQIWCQILDIRRVGRYDSFFSLGGHSLLAMRLIEQLSGCGWKLEVRDLFNHPVLSGLARTISQDQERNVPPNIIDTKTTLLTPEMLPLIELTQSDIDVIISKVPGGIGNIQDIYALSSLQEGILFHNLISEENDPYLTINFLEFDDRSCLERYLDAIQCVVNRQDILRTSFVCDTVSVPAQVVWRHASLTITEISVSSNDDSIYDGFKIHCFEQRRRGIDLESAPLLRFEITRGNSGHWLACQYSHHLIGDATTLQAMYVEMQAHLNGGDLPTMTPYRNLVHFMRTESRKKEAARFFTEMLRGIESPTLPFELNTVRISRARTEILEQQLAENLTLRLRTQTRNLNITCASLFHVAWALVLSRICDQHQVVFGTVLSGRMHTGKGSDTAMGLYINTLPFRVDVNHTPVQVAIRNVHNSLADLLEYEQTSLVFAQRCSFIPGGQPLFSSLLNFRQQRTNQSSSHFTGITFLETVGNTNFPLNISIDDDSSTLVLTIDAVPPVIPKRLCAYILKALEGLTLFKKEMLPTPLQSLEVLPVEERELMIKTWNTTDCHSSDPPCIHEIFEQQVLRRSDAIALVYEDEKISYLELNLRANRLAHQLMIAGVSPGKRVGLCTGRTPAMIVGILAILKAGGAYVPVDPAYASERLSFILNDAAPLVVLADQHGRRSMRSIDLARFMILDPDIESTFLETNPLIPELCSTDLAYVIYTSGTTGKPKGVMVQHRNIVRLFSSTDSWFHFTADDTWCLYNSIAFDVSVWEVWGCLSNGAKLLIVSRDVSRSPQDMWSLVREQKITILNLTPSAFSLMQHNASPDDSLRYILLGGEKLEYKMLQWWYSTHGDNRPQLVNMYGTTETTVQATYRPIVKRDVELAISPIGKRLSDNKIYLLDSSGQPVALGAIGELYIGGAGVASGYFNRYDLTERRYLPDSFSDAFDAKMYRTGDYTHYSERGELIYIGRIDDQIKIRGFRVEPSEVEACLTSHPQVKEAVVCVRGNGESSRLVAYVVGGIAENPSAELRKYASTKLPEYMVPSAFTMLDKFPLNQNGKIDRLALSLMDKNDFSDEAYEEPQTAIEIELARIWGELLKVDRVSRRDSFFALGGNSLNAVRMTERMKSIGWKLNVRDLFDHPILLDLANDVVQHQVREVPLNVISPDVTQLTPEMFPLIDLTQSDIDKIISRVPGGISNIQDIYALSPLQDGLLFHNLLAPENDPYNLICRMSFTARNELDLYLSAIQRVVDRHDILRTAFIWEEMTTPAQVVLRVATISVKEMAEPADNFLSSEPISNSLLDLKPHYVSLNSAPLLHYLVKRETFGRWILIELLHHLIMDHSTLERVHAEIDAFVHGKDVNLPEPSPFRNFIAEVKFDVHQEVHERFFSEMLADIDEPTMPYGVSQVYQGKSDVTESSKLFSHVLNKRLRDSAQGLNVSLTAIFHVAYAVIISVTSGRKNVVFGSVLLGRMRTDVRSDSTLGPFINTLPIRVNVDGILIQESLQQTHKLLARLFDHEHASLALAQRCSGVVNGMPLFTALLNYRHNESLSERPSIISGMEFLMAEERTNYPVNMSIEDFGTQLGLTTQIVRPISSERFLNHMQQALVGIADALEQPGDISVRSIEVLTCEERTELLQTRNRTEKEYTDLCCIHQYFERQAERRPAATAVVYENDKITYAQLNKRANRFAHELINLGVSPGELVGLCIGRTPALIVSVLAILKAGGAYVPVDPAYSSERSLYILDDATPRVVLADEQGKKLFQGNNSVKFVILDPNIGSNYPETNPFIPELSSKNLAYVIYTSGTTGKPKGVMVQHRNIVRLFSATHCSALHFNVHDAWCLYHSIAFDISVWELWGSLSRGAKLIIISQNVSRSPEDLWDVIREQHVTVLNLTPSAFRLLESKKSVRNGLRYIILAGEKLEYSTLQWWYSMNGNASTQLMNMYGPTEATVYATYRPINKQDLQLTMSSIGRKISDNKMYLLNSNQQPVPLQAIGELYIGGSGVASGYFNRRALTEERFVPDPFSDAFDTKMYRSGDLVYHSESGELIYVGRNDDQIKIRGFRIEPSEIEAHLMTHPQVKQAHVCVTGEREFSRMIAYVVGEIIGNPATELQKYASIKLPEHMVPSAFIVLDEFPLTLNGKIDRSSLPTIDQADFYDEAFEEPRTAIEIELARIWGELLGVGRVGRRDSFFALGGNSLHAVRMTERMKSIGWKLNVRSVFDHPSLYELANDVVQHQGGEVPANILSPEVTQLTPEMFPLIDLTQFDIDNIISRVPGGISNIQDIYALSPLQDGLLFHSLLAPENDPYNLICRMSFPDRSLLDRYLSAIQLIVDRHDILRTAFIWERMTIPAQVVWRAAAVPVEEIMETPESLASSRRILTLFPDATQYQVSLDRAPLLHYIVEREASGNWILTELCHHLIMDHSTLERVHAEVGAFFHGTEANLSEPSPFRNFIAEVKFGVHREVHERFFSEMLADIDEPTMPYGVTQVYRDGSHITESSKLFSHELNERLRNSARELNVSLTSVFHVAYAVLISVSSGTKNVVFGTVLLGRMKTDVRLDSTLGLFINTLPIRVNVDGISIRKSLQQTHNLLAELFDHEHASLALAQRCSGVANGMPLFTALLNYRHNESLLNRPHIIPGIEVLTSEERTNYPVNMSVEDFGTQLGLTAQVVRPISSERFRCYMQQALISIVDALKQPRDISVQTISVLTCEERMELLQTRNRTEKEYTDLCCIHQYFERQAERTPAATALVYANQKITYEQLNKRANQFAHKLINLGVSPGDLVGLCIGRTPALIVSVLAILKAGGAYVPVDPAHSSERSLYILDDATPRVVLADEQGKKLFQGNNSVKFVILDPNIGSNYPETNPFIPELSSTDLAYVIYTSGTTGKPKGVMVQHRNIVRLFSATHCWLHVDAEDAWCLYHSIAFDISVWELWGSLSRGAKLIIISQNVSRSPEDLWDVLREQHVTVLNLTPSAFRLLESKKSVRNGLRYIILAGEKLEYSTLQWWYSMNGNASTQLMNMYGPTEATVYATYRPINKQDLQLTMSSIGRKISDNKMYLLNSNQQPVPLQAIGELYIGGSGVASGYFNRRALTEERFVPDPFSDAFDGRMYRSGDCAYYSESGELIYVGRNDDQIKIRGFRIEPSEIEAYLITHPQVKQAHVCVTGEREFSRLVAYVVGEIIGNPATELRKYASTKLPEYMVPSAFVVLDKFPLTLNGKIDRTALPTIDPAELYNEAFEEPQTAIEIELARIWGELLGVDRVSRRDSFFALGGNSLHAVRMTERMKSSGWKLNVRNLFDHPILFELANDVVQHQAREIPANVLSPDVTQLTPDMFPLIELTQSDIDNIISRVPGGISNIQDIYALSPLQDGLLFHSLLAPKNDPYNLISRMSFTDRSLLDRYLSAIQFVVDRHDILRTAFIWEKMTIPAQVVWRAAPILVEEMTESCRSLVSVPHISTLLPDVKQYTVSVDRAPLLGYLVEHDNSGDWILTESFHHLIMDHSTLERVHAEIGAFVHGEEANLPEPSPFRNFIAEVKFDVNLEVHERFFSEMLADIDEPTMPYGVSKIHRDGSDVTESSKLFSPELNKHLRDSAQELNVSLTAIFHVAYAILISVTSGKKDVVFGTVLLGRMKTESWLDSTLGLFINTLPIRLNVDGISIRKSLLRTHNLLATLFDHEHASLALARRCSGVVNGMPLFTALLNYRHNKSPLDQPHIISGIEVLTAQERTNYPVNMSIEDFGTQLGLTTQVLRPISSEHFRSHMQQALVGIVDALKQPQDISVQTIGVLTCEERTELLQTRNRTEKEYTDLCCIHQYFERQAERSPAATALVYANQKITYEQLNKRANQFAHELINLGVSPGELVGLCIGRTPALIVSVLAILKAGGAYVPVDPAYSSERSLYILDDATPRVVLADEQGKKLFQGNNSVKFVILDPNIGSNYPETNPFIPELSSKNLAYVIYTSGTTGKPKGVMVQHRNIVRLFSASDCWLHVNADDAWCLYHSIAFDFSVWELWGSLSKGGKLVIVSQDAHRSPQDMWSLVREQNVTILNFTPSAFSLMQYGAFANYSLRYIIVGGEKLEYSTLQWWYSKNGNTSPHLVTIYGPTETTAYATYRPINIHDLELKISPIGRKISDNKIYLLDSNQQPVPFQAIGETYIGGAGVACGYWNRRDLSTERFLSDPFSDAFDAKMYRTGDLAHYTEDGELVYVGRNDEQVQIRGIRIEPNEIESCLVRHPAVHQAHVRVVSNESTDRLVAYIVADKIDDLINVLRLHAESQLPEYMVPSAFILLAEFPLTVNGKIDVLSLPAPEAQHFSSESFETPQGAMEMVVASTWGQLLGIDRVGRRDDFFALGGHSLLAIQMISLLAYRGIICTLNDLFQYPVLADFALIILPDVCLPSRDVVVSVRSSGTEPPLFCVPTGMGDFSYAFALSSHIRSSCPIYALPWPSFQEAAMQEMQELAAYTINLMKTVQPQGPYRICGYSSGGILAYCVAEMLLHAGDTISFVGLIDTPAPSTIDDTAFKTENNVLVNDLCIKWGSNHADKIEIVRNQMNGLDLIQCIQLAQELQLYPANVSPDSVAKLLRQPLFYERIMRQHNPEQLPITIHLFRAVNTSPDDNHTSKSFDALGDDSFGWSLVVPDSLLRIIPINGDHFSIVVDYQNRLSLCQKLCAAIDKE